MKKVTIPTEMQGIDWSKPQWVISSNPACVVLTTGKADGDVFEGTCLPCSVYINGFHSKIWSKIEFKPLTFDIPFTISNSNE